MISYLDPCITTTNYAGNRLCVRAYTLTCLILFLFHHPSIKKKLVTSTEMVVAIVSLNVFPKICVWWMP